MWHVPHDHRDHRGKIKRAHAHTHTPHHRRGMVVRRGDRREGLPPRAAEPLAGLEACRWVVLCRRSGVCMPVFFLVWVSFKRTRRRQRPRGPRPAASDHTTHCCHTPIHTPSTPSCSSSRSSSRSSLCSSPARRPQLPAPAVCSSCSLQFPALGACHQPLTACKQPMAQWAALRR